MPAATATTLATTTFQDLLNEAMPDMRIVAFDGAMVTVASRDYPEDAPATMRLSELLSDLAEMMREGGC